MLDMTMNDLLIEQAEGQVDAVIELWHLVDDDPVNGSLSAIFENAMGFLAYATGGLTEDFATSVQRAFVDGPVAMRALAQELKDRDYEGWDLPNPAYHRTVLSF